MEAIALLSSLATDLDLMLNDLRSTPSSRFIPPARTSISIVSQLGSDASQFKARRHPLGSVESEDGGNLIDDDLQALLPSSRGMSKDDLSQSRASLVSSSDGGALAEGETSSESSADSTSPPCDLGLVERLLRTHPVWFLPGIQRAGAVHLLQGKEEGNFVVRGSSQPNTMAVSVRLPPDTGPYIEHYLIQSNEGLLSLESSRFKFDSIPALIAHYAQCCDELPVQLTLPRALREAKNRQQLSSLALLGQEFWRYPMASPRPSISATTSQTNSKTESSGIGTTVFSVHHQSPPPLPTLLHHQQQKIVTTSIFSPTNPLVAGVFSQAGTPSDTTSSLSSFTSTGHLQMMSPESIDSVVLTMSPVDSSRAGIVGKTSTFKAQNRKMSMEIEKTTTATSFGNTNPFAGCFDGNAIRAPRPTPPNTLNLAALKTPPAPPPRWSKPPTPISPATTPIDSLQSNNFTVTTTVTFSVEGNQTSPFVEVSSPSSNTTTISKRMSPEGECKTNIDTLSSQGSKRWHSQSSKDSNPNQRKMLSPNSAETPSSRSRRSRAKKESKHYQESDILESPQVYCRSALGDKISDYEDLWSQDNTINSPLGRGGNMSSFRPDGGINGKRPDLLAETPTITSLNGNLLSPAGSQASTNASPPMATKTPSILSPQEPHSASEFMQLHNNNFISENNNMKRSATDVSLSSKQMLSPVEEVKSLHQFAVLQELHQKQQGASHILQPRNRLGLILPNGELATDEPVTPAQTPVNSRSKQGSPFYAEPADALNTVTRRAQRSGMHLPSNHRHSEPPKGPLRIPLCQIMSPTDPEKNQLAGSLDELKKKHRKARGRLDPWPLDSSWEFMGNDDENDYDTDANWKTSLQKIDVQKTLPRGESNRPLTVYQIIKKRMPDLNLPEIKSTALCNNGDYGVGAIVPKGTHRMSSYDNVEKGHSGYATSNVCHDSAQSDDGTVFSEPWDSSQWDSFFPHDDTSDTIHLSKCRSAICNSEDDTIIEESSHKDSTNTIRAVGQPQKVATILRSRSCRDREILCHPRNKATNGGPGELVAAYALSLANDRTSTFSRNIENFIACTKESRTIAPQVVMRNMRQFMSGMKNYLVKHGEGDFQREVDRARSQLKADEFLNLDTILERVMHRLVIMPLKSHLNQMFVDFYFSTQDLQSLIDNIQYAAGRQPADFGVRQSVKPPDDVSLERISLLITRLQEAELPLEKLEFLLAIVSTIFESTTHPLNQQLGADDFLPLLVFIVAQTGFISAEIEAEFMWGLLQPSLLNGEAGYYLTALCSAAHVLKSFKSDSDNTGTLDVMTPKV